MSYEINGEFTLEKSVQTLKDYKFKWNFEE